MNVPLVDLALQHRSVREEIERGMARLFESSAYILGPEVDAFECEFADFQSVRHCVGVASGTDAIELLLRAHDIGSGDEVVIPANTFIATALAVVRSGARPVLADCDADHLLLDPSAVLSVLSPRTRAILPVHLYGQIAPMEALQHSGPRGPMLLEDAAQAHGARRHDHTAGSFGDGAAMSFYPGKNLGAYGDAGAVLTNSDAVAARVRALRNYGSETKYEHPIAGFNSRLDAMQAVVLRAKLRRLAEWNALRRAAAARYDALLADVEHVVRPKTLAGNEHVWHLYVIRVPNRDAVLKKLRAAGIGAAVHYPHPIHLEGAMQHLGYHAGDFPVAERAASEVLSLPMFPEITEEQQVRVVEALWRR
ncbi:MAG TPA: DegT/DnrJ/EryC1/StrS family aminotransferase [Thermoanaerobaculia bacterium]|nr:DegT/DnrJ/EryC1/StrS family aminotransferase [Thermoanaerobaculia bacterium]